MRLWTSILLFGASLLFACTAPPPAGEDYDEAAIVRAVTEAMDGLTEAMNSHDPDQVFSYYRQDESFFYLGCTDILFGWETFATRVAPFYQFNSEVTFQRELLSIQVLSPTTAVAALRGSSSEAPVLFWTEVLQKNDAGRWLITYEHESWPGCSAPRGPHMGTEGMGGILG
jgi:ketosteroid isomerase-like protein